ncbi:MAG: hypothetical protein LKK00_00040 [Intestinimonas sp.]|jgi:hypothetical protein|nr:hypothetical protein [Intestinimonas sp.]
MNMEFLAEADGEIYEISQLVKSVSWTDTLNGGCGKLEFAYLAQDLNLENGAAVWFRYDDADIFRGRVFKHQHARNGAVTATAYDQLRYCKTKDTIKCKGDTVTTLVKKMCNYFGLTTGTLTDTGYTLSTSVQDSKTWLDIIYTAVQDTLLYHGAWFSLRDEYGKVCLRNLTELESSLILGDESLCYDYDYTKSIDDDFYNQIKLAVDNEVTGKRDIYMTNDSNSISKYGLLQYFNVMSFSGGSSGSANASSQAKKKTLAIQMANALMSLYNGETESLTMDCIGDTRIRAGSSFHACLSDFGMDKRLIVKSATHTFLPAHTMKLEVRI